MHDVFYDCLDVSSSIDHLHREPLLDKPANKLESVTVHAVSMVLARVADYHNVVAEQLLNVDDCVSLEDYYG